MFPRCIDTKYSRWVKLPISAMSELFPSQYAEISAKYIGLCSVLAFHLKKKLGRMSVSRAILLKVKTVGRSSVLRLLLVPLGHTSTTAEADNLQIWSGKAVKAHHSENNLTCLPKKENTYSPSYVPPGRALQVKLQIHSMREEFNFFCLQEAPIKTSSVCGFCCTYTHWQSPHKAHCVL